MTPKEFKEIRLRLKLTQPELGKILHLSTTSISRMENGYYRILHSHAYRMEDLLQKHQSGVCGAEIIE